MPLFATIRTYTDRTTKAAYIADKYSAILTGSVLDVGCDQAPLRRLVRHAERYVGVDLYLPPTGSPKGVGADLAVDLDREALPFADRSFDTVVCTDVLEHLERCHAVFDSLCRVAHRWVLVSLPNPVLNLATSLAEGTGGVLKHYGLPVDPPADRHRWFFGASEARAFLTERSRRAGFRIVQMDAEGDDRGSRPVWRHSSGSDVLDHANVRGGTLWCVVEREDNTSTRT